MKRDSGFSLVELSVALACLGLVAVLLLTFIQRQAQERHLHAQRGLLERVDLALSGFVVSHNRLPCVDVDGDGGEDCTGNAVIGRLPYVSLGLASTRAGEIRYGVYRALGQSILDRDLTRSTDRFPPMLARIAGNGLLAASTGLNQATLVDFCFALGEAGRATAQQVNGQLLHSRMADGRQRNVAYALAMGGLLDRDGSGSPFDGGQRLASGFDAPVASASHHNDDQIRVVGFAQLHERLGCGAVLAATGTAHFNLGTAALALQRGAIDQAQVMERSTELAQAATFAAIAGVTAAAAGITASITNSLLATADALVTYGATSGLIAAAIFDVTTNAFSTAAAAAALAMAECVETNAEAMQLQAQAYRDVVILYSNDIQANAVKGDRAQWWSRASELNDPAAVTAAIQVERPQRATCQAGQFGMPAIPRKP